MQGVTIYQIIHTLDGRIYHLEEHLTLLFEGYYELFGKGIKLVKSRIEQQIAELLKRSRCPRGVSLFVRLALNSEGEISLQEHERSLYKGYTLRCIRPRTATVEFAIPYGIYPTSIRDSLTAFANYAATKLGGDLALRLSGNVVDAINGAQIFALSTKGLITAADSHSVEHRLTKEVARKLDITIIERPILISELPSFDELFFVDHYGVTSIRSCNGSHYMSNAATTIATQLSKITSE